MTETDILSLNQTRIIEQTIITYLPLGKLLEKRVKTIEDKIRASRINELKQIMDIFLGKHFNNLIGNRLEKLYNWKTLSK